MKIQFKILDEMKKKILRLNKWLKLFQQKQNPKRSIEERITVENNYLQKPNKMASYKGKSFQTFRR